MVFQSAATNLTGEVSADNTLTHIYLRDVVSGVTLLISKNGDGVLGDNNSGGYNAAPKISPDGRFVIFASQAQNLITDGTPINDYRNAFVYDREEKDSRRAQPNTLGGDPQRIQLRLGFFRGR